MNQKQKDELGKLQPMFTINLGDDNLGPWGYIPSFLVESDERPVREQFAERYIGGWQPFKGFKLLRSTMTLAYPGDPPMRPLASRRWRNERIYLYPHAWVLILQQDGSWEVSRMD